MELHNAVLDLPGKIIERRPVFVVYCTPLLGDLGYLYCTSGLLLMLGDPIIPLDL